MQKKYNPKKIEKYVQSYWDKNKTFEVSENKKKKKYYCLSMLPYPSGKLHMGHVRNYTIGDVISRYQRMLGKNVLQPIGWDAFGLPAENAAIKNKIDPSSWTFNNINYMKKQLKNLGFSYDWSREITTCKSKYYHWEQWFFTKIYKKGLVYKKKSLVNWCPNDLTVLANEQVINNCCWRCDTKVELKIMPQWFIKITNYAEELLNDLKKLKKWPKEVKNMQKNWIGKKKGLEIKFQIFNEKQKIKIYTSKPEMFMAVTYLILSFDHSLTKKLAKKNKKIKKFIKKCKKDNINITQEGIPSNFYVTHPLNYKKIPIWIVNFISKNNEKKSRMSIPGYNKNDFKFANKYKLPIKIIFKNNLKKSIKYEKEKNTKNFTKSNEFYKLDLKNIKKVITNKLIKKGIAKEKITYRLRDWCVSRQRKWGTPIPMIQTNKKCFIPVPDDMLPIKLSKEKKSKTKKKKSKIIKMKGKKFFGELEKDTFDTFIESSWYYARYTSPNYKKGMINSSSANYWLPIDQYIGGIEHATMHLLYFRFFHKLMRDLGLVKSNEPAKKLLCQGMVLANTFYYLDKNSKKIWIPEKKIIIKKNEKNEITNITDKNGNKIFSGGMSKMSKLKKNGINPESIIKKYGADTLRLFIIFSAPPKKSLEWKESGIKGANRFIQKLWNLVYQYKKNNEKKEITDHNKKDKEEKEIEYELKSMIIKVNYDISSKYNFNTAISAIMQFVNKLNLFFLKKNKNLKIIKKSLETVIKMLSPFIPHVCFIMWNILGHKKNIDYISWPKSNKKNIYISNKNIIIQIDGKKRKEIKNKNKLSKKEIIKIAINDTKIKKYIKNKKIKKIIYIPKKILNFVIN